MQTKKRSYNQLRLYQGYFKQIWNAGVIKIPLDDKEWIGDLQEYVVSNYKSFETIKQVKDTGRYLLKMLDIELPTTKPITSSNINKNEFKDAEMKDLQHHIMWLREVLHHNKIVPFDDKY